MKNGLLLRSFILVCVFSLMLINQPVFGEEQYRTLLSPEGTLSIVRRPPPADYRSRQHYEKLPVFDPNSDDTWQMDLRSTDLSKLDIHDRLDDLLYADFDSKTIWPKSLPNGFDPDKIMSLGKNPGLGLRKLHAQGITGKGIGLAIIDQGLLVDHVEYRNQLKMYEEIHCGDLSAQMHGPAVASIAVGKSVGVAPGASLYYIAETHGVYSNSNFRWDMIWLAKSIDRIVAINNKLKQKIRVISISLGENPSFPNYQALRSAIIRAEKANIHVITVSGIYLGLGREPLKDPDEPRSYQKGYFWRKDRNTTGIVLIPMDSRCTASPTGNDDYVFYRFGGMSWAVPYVAGLYALACQVRPDITPEVFQNIAIKTGAAVNSTNEKIGMIMDPARLIEELRNDR